MPIKKRCIHRPWKPAKRQVTERSLPLCTCVQSEISKFCNVFLNIHLVLDMDKGKAFSPSSFMGWEKWHGILTCLLTQFGGYVLGGSIYSWPIDWSLR